ncbi:MAG: 3-hydroxyacyl-ACP dehydratase FabZ [Kiritimatiellae bacterium]|nr:3-hydroxyacyl-ACP dehydratase FabZ [Kiritimatiellia bacterium]
MLSYGIDRILQLLPHRYPFLLVDRVLEASEDGSRLVAVKNVTASEPYFQGHFPGNPIMPGVLQIEAMAQAAGLMYMGSAAALGPDAAAADSFDTILMSVDGAKFRRIVRPGDQLRIETTLVSRKGRIGKAVGRITVDGNPAAECTMMFMLAPRKRQ